MKTALVTGGTRGIGLGISKALLENGYRVALNGVRPESQVKSLIEELGHEVFYVQGDIGKPEDREKIMNSLKSRFDNLNLLVNNAGVAPKERKDLLEILPEDYDYVLDINLKGTFFLSQSISNWMMQAKTSNPDFQGCIVNISSISAEIASINRAEYCISKAGMSMLTKLFSSRLAEFGFPVYEVQPGIIETDMTAKVTSKYQKLINEGLTLEKRMGQPGDIGKIVVSLAMGGLPYSTGQVINADGGMSVRRL